MMVKVARLALVLAATACGMGESPVTAGGGGTAGSQRATGTTPNCPGFETRWNAACWQPTLGPLDERSSSWVGDRHILENLEVIGAVDADPALCEQGFPTSDPDSSDFWRYVPEGRAAWELEDPFGNSWIVQFGAEGLTSDVLSPGDVVTFQFVPSYDLIHLIRAEDTQFNQGKIALLVDRTNASWDDVIVTNP